MRGSEEATHRQNHILKDRLRRLSVFVAEALPLALVVIVPLTVHAGVFSSLISMIDTPVLEAAAPETPTTASEVKLLSASNNPDPKAALGGGDLIVEDGALVPNGPYGDDLIQDVSNNGEISVYVVREGDTLSQIAEMFDVTNNTILWANDLASGKDIHPGDTLVILPIVGVRHVVKEGDTITSIAAKYEGDEDEILAYNQVDSAADLAAGMTLIIPGGNMHTAPVKKAVSGGVAASSGGSSSWLIHPLPGAIKTQGLHGYNGVDLAAPAGTPIRAAASGQVIISKSGGWNGGYGNYVVIKHSNGAQTLYAHMTTNYAGVGAYVNAGETIGTVGSTGKSTGNHLHFEVRGAANPF